MKAVTRVLGAGILSALVVAASGAWAAPPQRIVSLNLCLDPLVLALAPRHHIAALSKLAADPSLSPIADKIQGLTLTRGGAEEVLSLEPDLVLAGPYTTPATVDLLRRLKRNVVVVPMADDIADVRTTIASVASALEDEAAGRALIADFDARLSALTMPLDPKPRALVYQVGGLVSTGGTLIDEALTRAGFTNAGTALTLRPGGRVGLESLVLAKPDLLVLAQDSALYPTAAADNLRHPVLAKLRQSTPSLDLAMPKWLCGTPAIADAVAALAGKREGMLRLGKSAP